MEDDEPGWKDQRRSDGARVAKGLETVWAVLPKNARNAVTRCPCCKRPMKTARQAKRVANALYPLPEEAGPG